LLNCHKSIVYDTINYYYTIFPYESIRLSNKKVDQDDKLIRIRIEDFVGSCYEYNYIDVKGFTIVNKLPEKQDINKFQLLEV